MFSDEFRRQKVGGALDDIVLNTYARSSMSRYYEVVAGNSGHYNSLITVHRTEVPFPTRVTAGKTGAFRLQKVIPSDLPFL